MPNDWFRVVALLVCMPTWWMGAETVWGQPAQQPYAQSVGRAISYLQKSQHQDGSYGSVMGPGVTALVTTGVLKNGRPPQDPLVAKSLEYLQQFVQPDGGIYQAGSRYRNYETCLAMMCLAEANRDGRYDELLKRADAFIKGLQWDAGEGQDLSSPAYGGAGYGTHARPDLSNTSFLIDALRAAGNDEDSDAIQRALVFVSRCQNLETEHNTTPFSTKNPDGGFYYTPAAGGTSQAGQTDGGGLRSYGSMTYAGLKSMIYAGVSSEDPRVQAAVKWIQSNYSLSVNPGMPPGMEEAGLYYYYHTFAKALDALGEPRLVDAAGTRHDWRRDLVAELGQKQQRDGSWVNLNVRWLEGEPALVTGYALLALSYCRPVDSQGE